MTLTPFQLAAAAEEALNVLALHGIPRDRVVLGVTNASQPERGTWYETHVGASHDQDVATMVQIIARAITKEADLAAVALADDVRCPSCDSPRYGFRQEYTSANRVRIWRQCMDCGHEGDER